MKKLEWLDQIEAIGWDLDGTLYPPDAIPFEVVENIKIRKVMERHGWDRDKSEREYRKLYEQVGSHTKTLTALGVNGVQFFIDVWDSLALEQYIHKDVKLVEMMRGLRKQYRLFVLSNSNTIYQIERKLRLVGFEPDSDFEFLLSTVGMEAVKPDPKPYLAALERLELPAEKVLYVGDRDSTDILGAKNVKMRTCKVWGRSELADVSAPTVYDVGEILD